MSRLKWDQTGERKYETGTKKGVLYVQNGSSYSEGVAWNGLTAVTESPSGAEANDMWADNIKYGSLRSAETFGGTIEAYTYPEEFKPCNGENELVPGVSLGQQKRNPFAFSYVSDVGNDTPTDSDDGYKIHIIYNATASPAEKGYTTINDSPEAITFSWEISTTPIDVPGFKPTASLEIDTTNLNEAQKAYGMLEELENNLYGTENTDATLLLPNEVADIIFEATPLNAEFGYADSSKTVIDDIIIPDLTDVINPVLIIPEGVKKILRPANHSPFDMDKIIYISFPDTLEEIIDGDSYGPSMFSNCNYLTKIILPKKLKKIDETWSNRTGIFTVRDSSNLKYIKIENNLERLVRYSFRGFNNLEIVDLISFNSTDSDFSIPEIEIEAFHEYPETIKFLFKFKDQTTLDAFASATNWSEYADYFEVAS